ncbi:MAG: Stk1 family PASTA domain-containing Ser/Thr kinase [Actinomycetota bacterium]|nr:Stk1 family PASTA domain-containing Ser/Thr kinase [Actinomycetota bacterium]
MPELSDGTMIDGRYHVLSRLGTGGMAEVYLAEDQQLGRKVALKLLHRRFSEDPDFVERFRREAQSAAGLQHPNVVSVYDRGAYDGTYYIAMEYLAGPSLKQLIVQDAPMDPLRAIDLTIQILKAARFAHRRGIIHRDLKPHNVIVGDGDHAKVTDFGIARAGASDMTETGSIMGTSQYLSPEQAQGHAVSPTSDLYAVGVILYEMVTGRVPFDAESAVTIAIKHVSEAPVAPIQINPSVPPELQQVILWALNKNPADRPADADAFISALEAVKVSLTEGSPSERTASFTALAAAVPAGAGVVAAAAIDPEGGEAVLAAAEGEEPPPEEPASAGGRRWLWALVAALLLTGVALGAYLLTRPATKLVPTVVGEKVSVAQTQIQNAGFTPNLVYRTDAGPAGTVIAQQPLGNSSVKAGSMVTLTVSQGPGNTTVPSVSGLTESGANRALRRAHLKVGRTETASSADVPAGEATRTDPRSGTSLPVGSAVTLFVSSGRPQTQNAVPDVTGQPQAAAAAQLGRAGFKVATSTQESSSVPAGNVISQSPSGGSTAAPGSTVSLVVASAPSTVKVPDVTGSTADAASGNLTGAGFTVNKKFKDVSQQNRDGIVISQSPGAGSPARKGDTVTIVVGRFRGSTTTTRTGTSSTGSTTTTTTTTT